MIGRLFARGRIRRLQAALWKTPPNFYTPFGVNGDPNLDAGDRRAELYARTFSTSHGREVLADILALSGIGRADFEPGTDALTAAFRSGVKANALQVARIAGLETGALGRALSSGKLEAMTHEDDSEPADE